MSRTIFVALALLALSCNRQAQTEQSLQIRVDSLAKNLEEAYKPGLGEFMSSIQAHHAKLWFAGENQNWKLCDFEIHEIMESVDDIQKYETERKSAQMIIMINPAIDSINKAIRLKSPSLFKSSYILLTNTCNNCHEAAQFEFNVVKIPETQTFSNQDFKPRKQ